MTKKNNYYKVLITTSGKGSRLKSFTQNTNKALLNINNKLIIDYIINSYPEEIEFVITLGFKGNDVKKYLKSNYKKRKFCFVNVSPFEGKGSSLGYSMLRAKKYLQCPFIFHCNDTIVSEKILSPLEENWSGGYKGNNKLLYNTQKYSTFVIKNGLISQISPKGASKYNLFHIGLVGIRDYKLFWKELESAYKKNPTDQKLNDVVIIDRMLQKNAVFKAIRYHRWFDTGNLESFEYVKKNFLELPRV